MNTHFLTPKVSSRLREIGFDMECIGFYNSLLDVKPLINHPYTTTSEDGAIQPYQAFDFFKERYNIDAWAQPFVTDNPNGIFEITDNTYSFFVFYNSKYVQDKVDYESKKDAEMDCIDFVIEYIKENKLHETIEPAEERLIFNELSELGWMPHIRRFDEINYLDSTLINNVDRKLEYEWAFMWFEERGLLAEFYSKLYPSGSRKWGYKINNNAQSGSDGFDSKVEAATHCLKELIKLKKNNNSHENRV